MNDTLYLATDTLRVATDAARVPLAAPAANCSSEHLLALALICGTIILGLTILAIAAYRMLRLRYKYEVEKAGHRSSIEAEQRSSIQSHELRRSDCDMRRKVVSDDCQCVRDFIKKAFDGGSCSPDDIKALDDLIARLPSQSKMIAETPIDYQASR